MVKKKLNDFTVDNFGKLNLQDPATMDYNADFVNTERDTNNLTGLVVELTKSEVTDEHRGQIGNEFLFFKYIS